VNDDDKSYGITTSIEFPLIITLVRCSNFARSVGNVDGTDGVYVTYVPPGAGERFARIFTARERVDDNVAIWRKVSRLVTPGKNLSGKCRTAGAYWR